MPSTARPPESSWMLAIDPAVTAAWRVTLFVTPVPRPIRVVAVAAIASATYGSPERFCESTTRKPSQPAASSSAAARPARRGPATPVVQISTLGPPDGLADQCSGALDCVERRPDARYQSSLQGERSPRP